MSKRLGGDHRLQRQTSSWYLIGFPMVVTLSQQYVGEKPTVVLYTYVNLHAGTPNKTKTKGHDELGLQLNLLRWV